MLKKATDNHRFSNHIILSIIPLMVLNASQIIIPVTSLPNLRKAYKQIMLLSIIPLKLNSQTKEITMMPDVTLTVDAMYKVSSLNLGVMLCG